jgi:chaperonin GroES
VSIRPLYDRVVVRRTDAETTTRGGIVLPGSAKEQPNHGEIVAVGPGAALDSGETRPLAVAVGDRVLFGKYSSNEIEVGGEKLLILKESDILAVIGSDMTVEEAA